MAGIDSDIAQVSAMNTEKSQIQNGAPVVFMREKAVFGDRRPEKQ